MTATMPHTAPYANSPSASGPSAAKHSLSQEAAMAVGLQFVQEYYTFFNRDPAKLHYFYKSNSTSVHGQEGEAADTCYGQQVGSIITSLVFSFPFFSRSLYLFLFFFIIIILIVITFGYSLTLFSPLRMVSSLTFPFPSLFFAIY